MPVTAPTMPTTDLSAGGRLVAADGRELPLGSVHISAEAGGGIARVVLTQRFRNPFAEPLAVKYLLPLPSDGAVSGFAFTLDDQRVVGEVTGRQQARERFERAIVQGKTAALLEQDRTSLFTQRVGNVPPGAEIVAEVIVDQPLRWLPEGAWEWRFPTVVGPRYQGATGRVPDAAKLEVPVARGALGVRATLALAIADALTGPVESTSHELDARGESPVDVRFGGDAGVRLDRDVVVRWPIAKDSVGTSALITRPDTAAHDGDVFGLLTVVPPAGGGEGLPRDLTFLIDTSGSMGGRPLEQAARIVSAMIETLGARDRIEMIEFGSYPKRWQNKPVIATESNKKAARKWLRALRASGCTEMKDAVIEALRPLRADSQRQVVLVTDGYIGFEAEIVKTLVDGLPAGARLHTIGVGSSINRSLTEAAARAGRGTEVIVGLDEDPDRVIPRLLARTTAPLVTDLTLTGEGVLELAPRQLPDLYAGCPALISVRLCEAGGELVLRGNTAAGPLERRLRLPACARGEGNTAIAALFAREKVEDLEMAISAGGNKPELDRTIEDTGVAFQIATRLTSWVAVSEKRTVEPNAGLRTVEQPHELPHGVSAESLGLRRPSAPEPFDRMLSIVPGIGRFPVPSASADAPGFPPFPGAADLSGYGAPPAGAPYGMPLGAGGGFADESAEAEEHDELILDGGDDDSPVINIGDIMTGQSRGEQEIVFGAAEKSQPPLAPHDADPEASGSGRFFRPGETARMDEPAVTPPPLERRPAHAPAPEPEPEPKRPAKPRPVSARRVRRSSARMRSRRDATPVWVLLFLALALIVGVITALLLLGAIG